MWSYPRGSGISQGRRDGIDVIAYAAQIAAQLGAHIIKVKLPTAHIEQAEAKKVYEKDDDPDRHAGRARAPRRAVAPSTAAASSSSRAAQAKATDERCSTRSRAIRDGGGFGSIIGRNSFQRKKPDALKFLGTVMGIYAGTTK